MYIQVLYKNKILGYNIVYTFYLTNLPMYWTQLRQYINSEFSRLFT